MLTAMARLVNVNKVMDRMFSSFVFVSSKDENEALIRLMLNPLLESIQKFSGSQCYKLNPHIDSESIIDERSCLIYQYDDEASVRFVSSIYKNVKCVICVSSDIYNFNQYTQKEYFTDLFLTPTRIHTQTLSSQLYKPVATLGEIVDPAATGGNPVKWRNKSVTKRKPRLLWFGYPESFLKSMTTVIPIVDWAKKEGIIDSFTIMTDKNKFHEIGNYNVIQYNEKSFFYDVQKYDYALLSHFSLDLTLNTAIKSPNKIATSISSGLIPIVSDTFNYSHFMNEVGLGKFLFSSPFELLNILRKLNIQKDSQTISDSCVVKFLNETSCESVLYKNFELALKKIGDYKYFLEINFRKPNFEKNNIAKNRVKLRILQSIKNISKKYR